MTAPLWILTILATAVFLRYAQALFVPMALAGLVTYALYPVLLWLEHRKIPRTVGAALILLAFGTALVGGAYVLKDDAAAALERLPEQVAQFRSTIESGTGSWWQRLERSIGYRPAPSGSEPRTHGAPGAVTAAPSGSAGGLVSVIWSGSVSAASAAGQAVVIVFLVYFLLIGARDWHARIVDIAGPLQEDRQTATEILDAISWQVQRFLLVRLATAVLVGIATWIALRLLGIPQAGVWGLLAGVFNSIPYFGPIIVSGGLAIVGFLSGGVMLGLEAAAVALLITTLEGWVITPPLLGQAARMNTMAIFVGLLVMSWVWNIWGTILAVPMLAVMKAIADHVPRLRTLSKLLNA